MTRTCFGLAITTFFTCGVITAATAAALPVASTTTTSSCDSCRCEGRQQIAPHIDAAKPSELAVIPRHRLGEGAVDIQSDDAHACSLRLSLVQNGSWRATRHLLIRARSASGKVARGGHVTSSGSQPTVYRRPARTFVLPVPHVPDGLTIRPLPCERQPDSKGTAAHIPDNGIVERFHKTVLDEFYRVAFRKTIYRSIAELQADLDGWVRTYNEERPHQGRWCFGKTPMHTFLDAMPMRRRN